MKCRWDRFGLLACASLLTGISITAHAQRLTVQRSALASPSVVAGPHCPGNVASVHLRHSHGSLAIVAVEINHTGPYDFVVDTGSQVTTLDPTLASRLHLEAEGTANLLGIGSRQATGYAHLDLLEIGSHRVPAPLIFIRELGQLQNLGSNVHGVIGGDVLRHFDVLLDQDKSLLCLDNEGILQGSVRGQRVPLATPPIGDGRGAATEPLIAEVQLPLLAARPLYLLLDSGANVPFLCDSSRGSILPIPGHPLHLTKAVAAGQSYVVLPAQDVPIGRSILRQVSFVVAANRRTEKLEVDGMLPTGLFRRIYISYVQHFMILEPW